MNKVQSIQASKIAPTFLIGELLSIQSRDLKPSKKPPKYSKDCNTRFYEYTARDNSKVTLLENYMGTICKDLFGDDFLNESYFSNGVKLQDLMLNKKDEELSGTKIIVYSTQRKLEAKKVNLTGRHKAQEVKISSLALCVLELEQTGILNSELLPEFKKMRLSQKPNNIGRLIV